MIRALSVRHVRNRVYGAAVIVGVVSLGAAVLPASASSTGHSRASVAGELRGVASISATDAWAVGDTGGRAPKALIEHWDGATWSTVDAVAPGQASYLYSVSASSATDVWAVGYYYTDQDGNLGFVEHWDGTQWTMSPIDAGDARLVAISAAAPDDVWAASREGIGDGHAGQAFHWDGSAWSEVAVPNIGWYIGFTGVVTLSPTDAWLSGFKKNGQHTILEHWDGSGWRIVASRDEKRLESLYAIAAAGPHDLWAVGLRGNVSIPPGDKAGGSASPMLAQHQLIMHSTGRAWKSVQGPELKGLRALTGVAAADPSHAWAVGFAGYDYKPRTGFIENWNGHKWVFIGSPGLPRDQSSILYSVGASSAHDAWAVGTMNGGASVVIEHWDGSQWTRVA